MTDAEIKELLVMFTWIYLIILPGGIVLFMTPGIISELIKLNRKRKKRNEKASKRFEAW